MNEDVAVCEGRRVAWADGVAYVLPKPVEAVSAHSVAAVSAPEDACRVAIAE